MKIVENSNYHSQVFNAKIKIASNDLTIEKAAAWSLLIQCLKHQTTKFDSKEEILYYQEELYAAFTGINLVKKSDGLVMELSALAVSNKFIEKNILQKVINLLFEQVKNNKLITKEIFEFEKTKAITQYQNSLENKQTKAINNSLKLVENTWKTARLNDPSIIEKIDLAVLNELKQNLQQFPIEDIYVITSEKDFSFDSQTIDKYQLNSTLSDFQKRKINQNFKSLNIVEKQNNAQSYLNLIYQIDSINTPIDALKMQIITGLIGASPSSKLFINVREKNSLCYHIFASYIDSLNVLLIHAGIQKQDYQKGVELIKNEMLKTHKLEITAQEIHGAKQRLIEHYQTATDNINQLISVLPALNTFKVESAKSIIEIIESIQISDLEKIIQKINLEPIIYFEEGSE